jgi:hypothetical protein
MIRYSWRALALCALCATTLLGQTTKPLTEVDQAEVLRLGDHVQYIDGSYRATAADTYIDAMAPPASDADKWFISVLSMKGCQPCERRKRDFATSPALLALADPNDPKKSWSHYNVYLREDKSQAFRFEKLTITGYPTIVVQPPRSGKFGDPTVVVFQDVYHGDADRLASDIAKAIRAYVGTLKPSRPTFERKDGAIGVVPPWEPPPKVDPYVTPNVAPYYTPDGGPLVPPYVDQRRPIFDFPWTAVLTLLVSGFSIPAIIALVIWLIYFIRERRKAAGQPLLLSDDQLAKLVDILNRLANEKKPDTSGK